MYDAGAGTFAVENLLVELIEVNLVISTYHDLVLELKFVQIGDELGDV